MIPHVGPTIAGNEPYGKGIRYNLNLKSRWSGDENPIRMASLRTMYLSPSDILSDGQITVNTGTTEGYIHPTGRSPLSHSRYLGFSISGGTGYVKATPATQFRAMAVMVRPNDTVAASTARIAVGNGTTGSALITFTKNGSTPYYYTLTYSGVSGLYINGSSITSGANIYVPYPVLLVASFASDLADVRFGNTYTGSGTSDKMSFDFLHTMTKYSGYTAAAWVAGDYQRFTDLFYRKPMASSATDASVVTPGATVIVPNPNSWVEVSSS